MAKRQQRSNGVKQAPKLPEPLDELSILRRFRRFVLGILEYEGDRPLKRRIMDLGGPERCTVDDLLPEPAPWTAIRHATFAYLDADVQIALNSRTQALQRVLVEAAAQLHAARDGCEDWAEIETKAGLEWLKIYDGIPPAVLVAENWLLFHLSAFTGDQEARDRLRALRPEIKTGTLVRAGEIKGGQMRAEPFVEPRKRLWRLYQERKAEGFNGFCRNLAEENRAEFRIMPGYDNIRHHLRRAKKENNQTGG